MIFNMETCNLRIHPEYQYRKHPVLVNLQDDEARRTEGAMLKR